MRINVINTAPQPVLKTVNVGTCVTLDDGCGYMVVRHVGHILESSSLLESLTKRQKYVLAVKLENGHLNVQGDQRGCFPMKAEMTANVTSSLRKLLEYFREGEVVQLDNGDICMKVSPEGCLRNSNQIRNAIKQGRQSLLLNLASGNLFLKNNCFAVEVKATIKNYA